ncbi:HET-domain-containing protein [Daldinia grandis]|nr:HET-domain-containing protein [Daldinia grandis]
MGSYRYDPLPGQDYIRLATIHPGKFEDDIVISFHTSTFPNDILPYEALSYVWGSEKGRMPIHVSKVDTATTKKFRDTIQMKSEKIQVTHNLDVALRHLRYANAPRVMWIDALCISQANEVERGPQVTMMGEIFRLARRVIAWLGPEGNDSNHAMHLLNYLGSQVQVHFIMGTMKPAAGCTDPDISDRNIEHRFGDRDVYSLYHLLGRQWFERLWIRQEIYLAGPEAVIMCGLYQVKWSSFRRGLACIYFKPIPNTGFFDQFNTRMDLLKGFIFQKKIGSLIGLNNSYGNTKCLDPRGRLYAVLALFDERDKALIPSPDYTQSYDKLYTTVIRNWIEYHGSVTILSGCQPLGSTCPSWVPDWSKSNARFNSLNPSLYHPPFAAWYEFPQPGVLRVMGVSKCAVLGYHQWPQMSYNRNTMLEQIRTLLLKVDLEEQHATEDYTRLLFCGGFTNNYDSPGFTFPDFKAAKQCIEFIMSSCNINDTNNKDFVQSPDADKLHGRAFRLNGHRIIRCTGGYIGIASVSAQPGDEVYTLLGCSDPLLLRPQGNNKFQVIGECFMLGLAYGEALLGPLPDSTQAIVSYSKRFGSHTPAFRDVSSGEIFYEDPRLKSLPVDLEDFRRRLQDSPWPNLHVKPDVFRERGVDLKCIDLV